MAVEDGPKFNSTGKRLLQCREEPLMFGFDLDLISEKEQEPICQQRTVRAFHVGPRIFGS